MNILIYPHDLAIGGSQTNAIDLAAAVKRRGHNVVVFGQPGALVERIRALDLEFVAAPMPRRRPSPAVVGALIRLVDERSIDILHGYEWPPTLECAIAAARRPSVRAVSTVMSMAVAPFIPRDVPLVVGTHQIAAHERRAGRQLVEVIEPPVDLVYDQAPSAEILERFRDTWMSRRSAMTVGCVTRLARELKLEGVLAAIDTIEQLAHRNAIRLLVVGDGPEAGRVRERAAAVNHACGEDTIVMTGELFDPRAAYAVSDVVIGMGGSALRGLAHSKPLIVQGERGYFRLLTPESAPEFLWQGWYGIGDGSNGSDTLVRQLEALIADPQRRDELGTFGRRLVEERFSTAQATERQLDVYESALRQRRSRAWRYSSALRSTIGFATYTRRRVSRLAGLVKTDDFNAQPVVSTGLAANNERTAGAVVFVSGTPWQGVAGTDRQLATALSQSMDVIYVDPPISPIHKWRHRRSGRQTIAPAMPVYEGIRHVRVHAPPHASRVVLRSLAHWNLSRAIRREVATIGKGVDAIVVAAANTTFPRGVIGRRIFFVTDDWVAGAELLGLPRRRLEHVVVENVREADEVAAVSPMLADLLVSQYGARQPVHVLPNGCDIAPNWSFGRHARRDAQRVGLVGQLNERIDLDILEALSAAGVELLIVGPRSDTAPAVSHRLDALLDRPDVTWAGFQPYDQLSTFHAQMKIGITPYIDNEFNRASFPLKTLEYLAAGLAVVSTDLPAVRWLNTDLIGVASTVDDFVQRVLDTLDTPDSMELIERRRAFAEQHSWAARADQLVSIVRSGIGD